MNVCLISSNMAFVEQGLFCLYFLRQLNKLNLNLSDTIDCNLKCNVLYL